MLQKNKLLFLTFVGIFLFCIVGVSKSVPFPLDIKNYLPSFTLDNWQRPHNTLLADPFYQFEPWRYYAKQQMVSGRIPLWNDNNASGVPFLANPQAAVLFPLYLLYYIFPVSLSLWLLPLLKLFFFGFFTYLYLRSLSCTKEISSIGSFIAMSSGFFITWLLWPHTNVFLFLPLLLYVTELIRKATLPRHRLHLSISIAYCIAVLGGHPETLFHIGIVHSIYVVYRLWGNIREIVTVFLFILCGFLLSALQLLPFLEYLVHSTAWVKRTTEGMPFYLPLISFIVNVIPFAFGAPHTAIYRSLTSTNFQEIIGGYTGTVTFIGALISFFVLRKNKVIIFWSILAIVSWLIAYNIFPLSLLSQIPYLKASANHRVIGVAGYAIIIGFTLLIEMILKKRQLVIKKEKVILTMGLLFIVVLLLLHGAIYINLFTRTRIIDALDYLDVHLLLLLTTSIVCVFSLKKLVQSKRKKIYRIFFIGSLFLQTGYLFMHYMPMILVSDYYPRNEWVQLLQSLPKGKIIEVGNPNLPPNINLVYNLQHAENDDAIEVYAYTKTLQETFPQRNQWEKIDAFSLTSFQRLGIRYVVSDFDINLLRQKVQPNYSVRLDPIENAQTITIPFNSIDTSIRQIRLLTANFNRSNTCKITIRILSLNDLKEEIGRQQINCNDLRDFMYYTVSFSPITVEKGRMYAVSITSSGTSDNNAIALWGNTDKVPYLEVLYATDSPVYKLLWQKKSVFVWGVPNSKDIDFVGATKIIVDIPEKKVIEYTATQQQRFLLKQIQYPGWQATIDGKSMPLDAHVFLSLVVPAGKHILSFYYNPLVFDIGIVVSILMAVLLSIYLIKKERTMSWWIIRKNKWDIKVKRIEKKVRVQQHITVLASGFVSGIVVSLLIVTYVLPRTLSLPKTSAINWLTVHQHSLTLDYIRIGVLIVVTYSIAIIVWIYFIWRKN